MGSIKGDVERGWEHSHLNAREYAATCFRMRNRKGKERIGKDLI